jgi:multidrug efflux pump subunit AcrA (membrane-fusion protein)
MALAGCGKSNSSKPPPPPLVTGKPVAMPTTTHLTLTGNTVAVNSVNLVARVSGYLTNVSYGDGSVVKKGMNLFVIEPAPYAALKSSLISTLLIIPAKHVGGGCGRCCIRHLSLSRQ